NATHIATSTSLYDSAILPSTQTHHFMILLSYSHLTTTDIARCTVSSSRGAADLLESASASEFFSCPTIWFSPMSIDSSPAASLTRYSTADFPSLASTSLFSSPSLNLVSRAHSRSIMFRISLGSFASRKSSTLLQVWSIIAPSSPSVPRRRL